MRRFALIFATVVGLTVATLNWVDSRYPGGIRAWLLDEEPPPPALPKAEVGPPFHNPAPVAAPPAAAQPAAVAQGDTFEERMARALWPGSKIERIVYGARPYLNMTVVSISAQNVIMRNESELVSIPTASLPDDLRTMAIAYLNGTDGPPFARSGAPAFPVQGISSVQSEPDVPKGTAAAPPPDEAADIEAVVWEAARKRAERWLRIERERRTTDVLPLVTGVDLRKPYPVTGLPGYWRVRGRGYVATHQTEKGGMFHDFEITIVLNEAGATVRTDIKIE